MAETQWKILYLYRYTLPGLLLAKVIFFDNQGVFKTSDYEEIMNKASCLSLVSNAVLLWNTHHMQKLMTKMEIQGHVLQEDIIARIAPLTFKNITVHGIYHFVEPP